MLSDLMNQILMMKQVILRRFGHKTIIHRVTDVSDAEIVMLRFGHYVFFTSTVGAVPGGLDQWGHNYEQTQ